MRSIMVRELWIKKALLMEKEVSDKDLFLESLFSSKAEIHSAFKIRGIYYLVYCVSILIKIIAWMI